MEIKTNYEVPSMEVVELVVETDLLFASVENSDSVWGVE